MSVLAAFQSVQTVSYEADRAPVLATAAKALAKRLRLPPPQATSTPGADLTLTLAGTTWDLSLPTSSEAWLWAQVTPDGHGTVAASSPALLYALVHLIADDLLDVDPTALAQGVYIEPTFAFHRPHFDNVLTQVSRTIRAFDAESYIAELARCGFTHLEVNGLAFHIPFEPGVPTEYYNQFYTYCPGFNHFVDSTLTRGYYPAEYLQANLNRVKRLAKLGRKYGLKPGMVSFEPRSLPEHFFQRYPTLRGARIDHPFRSHQPRYTLAQDHPVAQDHYRQVMRNMMEAVPDLSYLSVWTNDSGAGFEHTSSLYVGRNGGPYLIREWREHEQIAETAGKSALRWMRLLQQTAAETNPDFEVLLRIEPFKVEHDTILAGMGEGVSVEAPSLLVRGYELPYQHPRYPEQTSVAGSIFHTDLTEEETDLLTSYREQGFEPKLNYSVASSFNTEPLLGIPFPRMLHKKLMALRERGFKAASAFGGLLNLDKTPYWPHPEIIRAAQFTPDASPDTVLHRLAEQWVGEAHTDTLVKAWYAIEEAISYLPLVPLYSHFGFVWLRTWVRPLVPNMLAIPEEERLYYERFLVSTANNPNIDDLGRDVLFTLITEDSGRRMAEQFDTNVLARLEATITELGTLVDETDDAQASAVFTDLRDRAIALQCWSTTQRNTCAWVAGVYGYRTAETDAERQSHVEYLQAMIDLDLANTQRLLDLWETSETEVILVSEVGETSFVYGENIGEHLRRKLTLTEQYRHHAPSISEDLMWKLL